MIGFRLLDHDGRAFLGGQEGKPSNLKVAATRVQVPAIPERQRRATSNILRQASLLNSGSGIVGISDRRCRLMGAFGTPACPF
jgi:hypothetical protein